MDEDLVDALRSRNIAVLSVADVGMLNRSDEEQLDWARQNNRVLFSFNTRDYYRLHIMLIEQGLSHTGIILAPQQRYGVGEILRGLLKLINSRSLEDMQGQVVFLSNWIS